MLNEKDVVTEMPVNKEKYKLKYKKITDFTDKKEIDKVLHDVFEIDKAVYSPELCGSFRNLCARFDKCQDAFILVYDGETLAGYVTFVLAGETLYTELTDPNSSAMRDDDITPDEIEDWCEGKDHHVFIVSIAVKPDYQHGGAVKVLAKSLLTFLREKEAAGYHIASISGSAVSGGGAYFLQRFHAKKEKMVDGGYTYYRAVCPATANADEKPMLRALSKGLLAYKKSYENDIFFFLPMTDAEQTENVLEKLKEQQKTVKRSKYADVYCEMLNHHVDYECNILDTRELERVYLGEFDLACYDDDYDLDADEEIEEPLLDFDFLDDPMSGKQCYYSEEYTVDEKQRSKKRVLHAVEKVHLFVTAHKQTGIYIVTLALPDNRYIPTQLIDQMSTGHLDFVLDDGTLVPVEAYMRKWYSLELYGESKCVVCLSEHPKSRTELGYLLAGETYVSSAIDYQIRPNRLENFLKPRAYYDYYDSYISKSVIAFVFKEYSDDFADRLDDETSELFITEVVLLQNTAVVRTNRHVAEELSEKDGITLEEIEKLYIEFGKTMKFWRSDVFKYPGSQLEADEVIRSFGITQALEEYHRNHQFLDRYVQLDSDIKEQKSADRMNAILYVLAWIEGASIVLGAILGVLQTRMGVVDTFWWAISGVAACMALATIFYVFVVSGKDKKKRKRKKK